MSVVHSEISNNERSVAGRHRLDTAAATHSTVNARLLIAAVVILACLSVAPDHSGSRASMVYDQRL